MVSFAEHCSEFECGKINQSFFFFKGSTFFVLFEKFFFIKSQTTAVSSLPHPSSKIIGTEKSNFILFILGFFHWAFEGWLRRVFGRDDAKAETPVLWPLHVKSWLIGKDSDAGRDWGQEEKGMTEDEMAGWHHWLDGRESEWTPGVGDGQGGLVCCDSWGHKELDTTEWLNWTERGYTFSAVGCCVPHSSSFFSQPFSAWSMEPPISSLGKNKDAFTQVLLEPQILSQTSP